MILAILALLVCQLAGEAAARALGLPLPGPVLGLLLMMTGFALIPGLLALVRPVAQSLLANLSLLFIPAGVGIVGHLDKLGGQLIPILAAIVLSTNLAIAVGALTFGAVARLTGTAERPISPTSGPISRKARFCGWQRRLPPMPSATRPIAPAESQTLSTPYRSPWCCWP